MTDHATLKQIEAADPERSTWVSANAGSGKTRVLTNRVARLLLAGCAPQKILCLTYTKAAAAEMQNRLFGTLGSWAMKPDGALAEELAKLGEKDVAVERLAEARKLFARALETPGGLKIQTIHSFCGAVLRRFPLEAGVSPQFREMDDRQAKQLRAEILEEIAEKDASVFAGMAAYLSGEETQGLLDGILKNVNGLDAWDADLVAKVLEAEPAQSDDILLAQVMQGVTDAQIVELAGIMATGGAKDKTFAARVADGLAMRPSDALDLWEQLYLTGGRPRSESGFPVNAIKNAHPWVPSMMAELKARMFDAREARLRRNAFYRAKALYDFAQAFLSRYQKQKSLLGRLDFDDLIHKTKALLTAPGYAGWVLFRLDGGIDHILVDEAQDTSPDQWDIVRLLADEFYVGDGAHETPRTIFVVGDEKQSIYSFQGADPHEFGRMRAEFAGKLAGISAELQTVDLLYSFRSAAPVLELVDRVFVGDVTAGVEGAVEHRAFKEQLPGRVEVWPFIEKPEQPEPTDWWEPVDSTPPDAPHLMLAEAVAERVADIIDGCQRLPGTDRAITAGDFMILVQSRGPLFHAIIKALKAKHVDVAGADRLRIIEELAVRDLLALLSFIATPADDLSLAAVLRSPLFGLSEGDLYALAHGRKGTLWQSLWAGRNEYSAAFETLNTLQGQADFIRPYDLLEQVLVTHDGRRKLLARLGPEAEDGIDELVNQSLAYESVEAPTLTGFLSWISSDDVEVKRQMDAEGNRVRVMTVHGAKGLESPIVILPDTTKRAEGRHPPQVVGKDGVAVWKTSKDDSPAAMLELEEDRKRLVREESERLLYVAMTRAENWLIVAGAGSEKLRKDSWYDKIAAGMPDDAERDDSPTGESRVMQENWVEEVADTAVREAVHTEFPAALNELVPAPQRKPQMLSPSDLGGEHALSGGDPVEADAAKQRGTDIHALLEVLPTVAPAVREETAARLVEDWQDILPEVETVLDAPELANIFHPNTLAEVPITAHIKALDAPIMGRIDRLVVAADYVLAVDFKSNRDVPDTPEATPSGFLKQMGAYGAALAQIYPDKEIRTAILWTRAASLMELPENVTAAALRLDAPQVAT